MVNTDLLPAAPQIAILSSFFLVELPDSKSQLMEQIVLSIMVFCLGGSHQSLKIFCFNLKKVLKILSIETQHYHQDQVRLKEVSDWHWEQREPSQAFQKETEPSLHHHLNHHLNHHHQNQNLKAKMEAKQVTQPEEGDGHRGYILFAYLQMVFDLREHSAKQSFCPRMPDKE